MSKLPVLKKLSGQFPKIAWRMCNLIRRCMGYVDSDYSLGGKDNGLVEADKDFVGGKDKRGEDAKAVVISFMERGGEAHTKIIPSRKARHIEPAMLQLVKQGSLVTADENGCMHGTVNHRDEQYVDGAVHTNSTEAVWSHVKRSMSGTYVSISKRWQTYLWELEHRQTFGAAASYSRPLLPTWSPPYANT